MANENQLLDPINRRLLQELQTDARVTMAELGRRINLSAPAVADSKAAERSGCAEGFPEGYGPCGDAAHVATHLSVRRGG